VTGRVILVIGPSSAGKSTLAAAIQAAAPEPWIIQSLDGLFAAIDDRWGSDGERRADGFRYELAADGTVRVVAGPVGQEMLAGFRRAVAAYAHAGVNVIVDDMLLDAPALDDWAAALAGLDVRTVRLSSPLAVLASRDRTRPHGRVPGLAAGHFALHAALAADLVIDTSTIEPAEAARTVLALEALGALGRVH
jgi:chloramphenicol 3-O phosphotransferase